MAIDYEKWREGVGYDLEAIREASHEERQAIEILLLNRGARAGGMSPFASCAGRPASLRSHT